MRTPETMDPLAELGRVALRFQPVDLAHLPFEAI